MLDGRVTELVITRDFAAPRALVFRAFTDPDQLARWFAPAGWSVPRGTVEVQARTGGVLRLVMVNDTDPELTSPVNATFTEVIDGELLAGEEQGPDGVMRLRVEFAGTPDGGTRLTVRQGPYPADIERMAREGWTGTLDKLERLLKRSSAPRT